MEVNRREYRSIPWKGALFFLAIAAVALFIVVYSFIDEDFGDAACIFLGVFVVSWSIPSAIYFFVPRTVVVTGREIAYRLGRIDRFRANWEDVLWVSNALSPRRDLGNGFAGDYAKLKRGTLTIKSTHGKFELNPGYHLSLDEIKQIFLFIADLQQMYPRIELRDRMGWLERR